MSSTPAQAPHDEDCLHHFRWPSSDHKKVFVKGSFDDWNAPLELLKDDSTGEFISSIRVEYGKKLVYKYVVDDIWKVNPSEPTQSDSNGNLNNYFDVPALNSNQLSLNQNQSSQSIHSQPSSPISQPSSHLANPNTNIMLTTLQHPIPFPSDQKPDPLTQLNRSLSTPRTKSLMTHARFNYAPHRANSLMSSTPGKARPAGTSLSNVVSAMAGAAATAIPAAIMAVTGKDITIDSNQLTTISKLKRHSNQLALAPGALPIDSPLANSPSLSRAQSPNPQRQPQEIQSLPSTPLHKFSEASPISAMKDSIAHVSPSINLEPSPPLTETVTVSETEINFSPTLNSVGESSFSIIQSPSPPELSQPLDITSSVETDPDLVVESLKQVAVVDPHVKKTTNDILDKSPVNLLVTSSQIESLGSKSAEQSSSMKSDDMLDEPAADPDLQKSDNNFLAKPTIESSSKKSGLSSSLATETTPPRVSFTQPQLEAATHPSAQTSPPLSDARPSTSGSNESGANAKRASKRFSGLRKSIGSRKSSDENERKQSHSSSVATPRQGFSTDISSHYRKPSIFQKIKNVLNPRRHFSSPSYSKSTSLTRTSTIPNNNSN
ncbi:hypothetical protein O181_015958 [Austropuccinia psidii MF-1]|uniref:AMP-activated protein kinase glycogen-binding domain-containing protein n=1 Tax=Austropuccinia psidii MF-1 TaxID=1389203 RepID=A0A9Q3GQF2_9BASI|nr:hypothetical protein [Austropuccinia psidii MF-1]